MVVDRIRLGRSRIEALRRAVNAPEHGSTADAVTETLREAIVTGVIPPNTWLREDDLTRSLKVSRTPVRDALRRLADDGLTVRIAHHGSVVAPITTAELTEIYFVREVLESAAARIVAERRDPEAIAELTRLHSRMVACRGSDSSELRRLSLEFHRLVRESTGNRTLTRSLQQLELPTRRFPYVSFDSAATAKASHDEHAAILRTIAAGDPDAAAEAAAAHVRRIRDLRLERLTAVNAAASPAEVGA